MGSHHILAWLNDIANNTASDDTNNGNHVLYFDGNADYITVEDEQAPY